jgi:hypothetical protein
MSATTGTTCWSGSDRPKKKRKPNSPSREKTKRKNKPKVLLQKIYWKHWRNNRSWTRSKSNRKLFWIQMSKFLLNSVPVRAV